MRKVLWHAPNNEAYVNGNPRNIFYNGFNIDQKWSVKMSDLSKTSEADRFLEQTPAQVESGRDSSKTFNLRIPGSLHARVANLCNNLLPGRVSMNELMISAIEKHVAELEQSLRDEAEREEERVNLNVEMSEELHAQLRIRVIRDNIDINTVVTRMIEDYVAGAWAPNHSA